jgi:plastocyanin
MKKFVLLFVLLSLAAALLTACGGSTGSCGSSSGTGSSNGSTPMVHMCGNNFVQMSITINKGQSLTLIDDESSTHIIANGSWVNGSEQPKQEPGAPVVNNPQFNGNDSHTIGPFNTPVAFHYYCTIHQGMNLTIIVQ